MFKKTKLAISAVVLLFISGSQANHVKAVANNCTGTFHEDINAAFYECMNERGSIESRSEVYYDTLLEHECSNVTYGNLTMMYNGTQIQGNYTEEAMIRVCDYFQWGKGYEFSWLDHDIGLIHIHEKVGGERSLSFQNSSNDASFQWDW